MRKASGVILILAGLAVAVHALMEPRYGLADRDDGPGPTGNSANITTIAKSTPVSVTVPHSAEPQPDASPAFLPPAPPVEAAPQPKWNPALARTTRAPRVVAIDGVSRTPVGRPPSAGPPLDRVALTRELQRQLHRVGCYGGQVTGEWTPSTRRAMKEFIDRMNAALPFDQPDQVLLAMLKGHEDKACGRDAVVAGAAKRSPGAIRATAGATAPASAASAVPAGESPPIPGRMALAGPKNEDDAAAVPGPDAASQRQLRDRRRAARSRAGSSRSRYTSNSRRPFGPWIFRDEMRLGW